MNNVSARLRVNIRQVAKDKRYTLKEVAKNAGIHQHTLHQFLRGDADMTLIRAECVAGALGMTLTGLINWRKS